MKFALSTNSEVLDRFVDLLPSNDRVNTLKEQIEGTYETMDDMEVSYKKRSNFRSTIDDMSGDISSQSETLESIYTENSRSLSSMSETYSQSSNFKEFLKRSKASWDVSESQTSEDFNDPDTDTVEDEDFISDTDSNTDIIELDILKPDIT